MLATYVSLIAICAASLAVGQTALRLCGWRRWSWLAPAVGLALVTALCWATVRLPGDGLVSAISVLVATAVSLLFLRGRVEGVGEALREGAPVAIGAVIAASLPFIVEGRFGILGTSFNPDMSQHLLAADRLAHGSWTQLLGEGYPLGPHAIVIALNKGLGIGLVQGFGGLTLAVAVLASLTALAALAELGPVARWMAALLIGLPYMVASYLAQGAFKETMEALFLLAFALLLWEIGRRSARGPLVAVPLAVLAAGSVFAYSFAGLTWLVGALGLWAVAELFLQGRSGGRLAETLHEAARPAFLAMIVFAVLVAPELGRMADFASFETFDPAGPGLGNLFGQISPAEALGVWPSGDFRLSPGDGVVPAVGFYLGVVFAAALLAWSLVWWLRRGEMAIPAALAAAALGYAAARVGGTPYTAAKAVQMAAPLAALAIVRPLFSFDPAALRPGSTGRLVKPAIAVAFAVAAGGCSLLALANGPVGPTTYSSGLATLRPQLAGQPVLMFATRSLLTDPDQHGVPYLAWELRGTRLCFQAYGDDSRPPRGVRFVIAEGVRPPLANLELERRAGPFALYRIQWVHPKRTVCPLIAVRSARQGEKQGG